MDLLELSVTANAEFAEPLQPMAPDSPEATATTGAAAVAALAGSIPETASKTPPASPEKVPMVVAALTASSEVLSPGTTPLQPAITDTPNPESGDVGQMVGSVEILDECLVVDTCIDRYLWALYRRTPKEDTIKEEERRKVTIKRKGKLVTVTRTFTKLVDEDFAWKDPKAADKAGMAMMDYVIGGMDRSFKVKLFRALLAAEQAGLSPGITSAFRDDYRQSIASGLKAATDRSYHGGSFRGGYGHGLAADVVSVKGATRAQRWVSNEVLWKWIDARGKEFGIGRPYLDRDPPHVAPVDGKEYANHNSRTKERHAGPALKKRNGHIARADDSTAKRSKAARSSKVRAT